MGGGRRLEELHSEPKPPSKLREMPTDAQIAAALHRESQTPRPEADPWGALVSGAATHGRELGHCNSPSNPKCGYCNECRTCDGSCTNCCPELVHALNWASEYPPSPIPHPTVHQLGCCLGPPPTLAAPSPVW